MWHLLLSFLFIVTCSYWYLHFEDIAFNSLKQKGKCMLKTPKSVTNPTDNIDRVEIGSFNSESPFYQMNLNNLKPFAYLHVKRLAVYPIKERNCNENDEDAEAETDGQNEEDKEAKEEPRVLELSVRHADTGHYSFSEWYEWSPCVPDQGRCGLGTQIRTRSKLQNTQSLKYAESQNIRIDAGRCQENQGLTQSQACFIDC